MFSGVPNGPLRLSPPQVHAAVHNSGEREPFDLVFMDIQMPEMGGLEATRAIRMREQVSGSRTPIVALTTHAMKGDKERYLNAGMDGYVSKPIRRNELYETIECLTSSAATQ